MRKTANFLRSHYKLLSVGAVGVLAGVGISAFTLVQAAIPDTDGSIHGCRNSTTTLLRVIDSAGQSCDSNETSLNWDQKGVRGYGRFTFAANTFSVDTSRSYNISNLHVTAVPPFFKQLCFTVSGNPKNISLTREGNVSSGNFVVALKDENGWTTAAGSACDSVDSSTNVYINGPTDPFFVTIH